MLAFVLVGIAAALALVWVIGAREPVFANSRGAPVWFVAWKGARAPRLADGVRLNWTSHADFALIGTAEAYWTRFYILSGGAPGATPIDLGEADDAYVARLKVFTPPRFALGMLRVLTALGVLSKPKGEITHDVQALGFRSDVMPSASAIAQLLAKPADYSPCMVNFLGYYGAARYKERRADPGTGAAAYRRYGMVAMRTVYRTGGTLLFYGAVEEVLREAMAGPSVGAWHDIAAMRYPNPAAILSMEHAPEYRAALHHRDAGLDRTIVIASTQQTA
ncbi:MAG: DUF1330 domain-containing protein [Caulobacterales bacterium]|nr:DUF1330 domain-containing protein [Caulobacterales bacterium]